MRVILVCYGRPEQGKDSIAGGLDYVATEMIHRIDHEAQGRIHDRARLLRIHLLHQIHRTFDVGEEGSHRLTLFIGGVCNESLGRDANRTSRRTAVCGRSEVDWYPGVERTATLSTEFEGRRILECTSGAA